MFQKSLDSILIDENKWDILLKICMIVYLSGKLWQVAVGVTQRCSE